MPQLSIQPGFLALAIFCISLFANVGVEAVSSAPIEAHSEPVGEVIALRGKAFRVDQTNETSRLKKGSPIYLSDRLLTEKRALISIQLSDKTKFFLGQESEMRVDEYVYNLQQKGGKLGATIVKGTFKFVTGLIAKETPQAVTVKTKLVGTIGIRGTTVAGHVEEESATIVLLASESGTPSKIEVANSHGSVVLDKPGYGTHIPDANSPPSPPERMRIRAVDQLMRNIQSIQRISVPRIR